MCILGIPLITFLLFFTDHPKYPPQMSVTHGSVNRKAWFLINSFHPSLSTYLYLRKCFSARSYTGVAGIDTQQLIFSPVAIMCADVQIFLSTIDSQTHYIEFCLSGGMMGMLSSLLISTTSNFIYERKPIEVNYFNVVFGITFTCVTS